MEIRIKKEFGFNELTERLRNVSLRGFPNIKIYDDANIEVRGFFPREVQEDLFTPQPSVYAPMLNNVEKIYQTFIKKGIDIFRLEGGVDYIAVDKTGEETDWTIIPPVIEILPIKFNKGRLDYSESIGEELKQLMDEKGYEINPELNDLPSYNFKGITEIPEICDGSHRIELARKKGLFQKVLFIDAPKKGFPYYAAPKPYSSVHEEPERIEEKLDKTHVLTSPGHKTLYRLFPSGGIHSGTVRPLKQKYD